MEIRRRKYKLNLRRFLPFLIIAAAAAVVLMVALMSRGPEYRPQTEAEIAAIIELNEARDISPMREAVAEAAVSLVGKVPYFWGGKSSCIGFDGRWNTPVEVTSEGSSSTGGTEPFGLDCSGFVTWCFIQAGLTPSEADTLIGNGTWNQWDKSKEIAWKALEVGDIVFIRAYPTDAGNHIGICVGFDERGEPYFAHCSSTYDNVVVTPAGDVFRYARRPAVY